MNDDIEGRLRTGLTELADHAWSEPSRSLTLEDASEDGPSHSRLRRLAAAAAVACVAAGGAVLLTWDRGDDPDSSPAPTTEATAPPSGTLLPPIDGCPADRPGDWAVGEFMIDYWTDTVHLNGRDFEAPVGGTSVSTGTLGRDKLGERVGLVCFTLSDMRVDFDKPLLDGDATFLPRGTELYAIRGSDPTRRIAALVDDRLVVYEVHNVPGAEAGGEAIDLTSGFDSIGVRRGGPEVSATTPPGTTEPLPTATTQAHQGDTPQGVIDDPQLIRTLIDDLEAAPIRGHRADDNDGSSYAVDLHRSDGTITQMAFHPDTSVLRFADRLAPAIVMPDSWADAIRDALSLTAATTSNPKQTVTAFARSGACGDAYFWATTADDTLALTVSVEQADRSLERVTMIDFRLPDPDVTVTEIHGRSLSGAMCNDLYPADYRLESENPIEQASGHIELDPPTAGSFGCGSTHGLLLIEQVKLSNGGLVDRLEITADTIGCYAG